jgi:hypothetical protein
MLVSVDPGLRECGVAVWDQGRLVRACLVEGVKKTMGASRTDEIALMAYAVWQSPFVFKADTLVTEEMTVYKNSPGNPNALRYLDQVSAYLAGLLDRKATWHQYQARTWKGNTKKALFTAQIQEELSAKERLLLPKLPKSKLHHVLDAVALGKFHLGKAYDRS